MMIVLLEKKPQHHHKDKESASKNSTMAVHKTKKKHKLARHTPHSVRRAKRGAARRWGWRAGSR